MSRLFTKKDIAERWQIALQTVDSYIRDGIITPIKGIPSVRFTEQHILEIEGVQLERFSPIERRKLERELEEWKIRAIEAEKAVARASVILNELIYVNQKQEKAI